MKFTLPYLHPRRAKYGNRKTEAHGQRFDSKAEAARYGLLLMLERAGDIRDLERQVKFELIPKCGDERACSYVADFVYSWRDPITREWSTIVEDVKGMRTPDYVIKRKLMLQKHGIRICEVNVRRKAVRKCK